MDMVDLHTTFKNLSWLPFTQLFDYIPYGFAYFRFQKPESIFRTPYNMVFALPERMC